jgi:hypothetical protein
MAIICTTRFPNGKATDGQITLVLSYGGTLFSDPLLIDVSKKR